MAVTIQLSSNGPFQGPWLCCQRPQFDQAAPTVSNGLGNVIGSASSNQASVFALERRNMPLISIKCGRRTCMVRKFVWRENLAVSAEEGGRTPRFWRKMVKQMHAACLEAKVPGSVPRSEPVQGATITCVAPRTRSDSDRFAHLHAQRLMTLCIATHGANITELTPVTGLLKRNQSLGLLEHVHSDKNIL